MSLEAIDHVQLAMPPGGEDRARAFYGAVLGLAEQPKPAELARRGGCWFEGAVKVHCGVEEPFHPARKAHIAFRVDDVAALAERARKAGFEVKDDKDLPGHERVFIFDPFGNRLEFLRPLASPSGEAETRPEGRARVRGLAALQERPLTRSAVALSTSPEGEVSHAKRK